MAVDERDREDLFQDFIDELFEEEREAEAQRSKQVVESIKQRLEDHEDIGLDTRWRQVNDVLHQDPLWKNALPLERLTAFEEFIKEKDKADFLLRKAKRQRVERKRRESFRDMIEQMLKDRKISGATESKKGSSKWAEFVKDYQSDPRYSEFVGQSYPYTHSGGGTSGS